MDLNIAYKTYKTSKNTRNSYFRKNREIRFSIDISRSSRHTPSSLPCVLSYFTTLDHNNLNLPSPALHTNQTTLDNLRGIPSNDVSEEV